MVWLNRHQQHLKRLSRSQGARVRCYQRKLKNWHTEMENFNLLSTVLINKQGKTRSDDENKIILLALKAALKRELKKILQIKK